MHVNFGSFFDSIKVVIEKKMGGQQLLSQLEWSVMVEPKGRAADCFRFKLYHDKPCNVKIYLQRSDVVQPRYELSPQLREVFPLMRWDPTDEDILQAIWSYIMDHGLMDPKLRTSFRTDAVMLSASITPIF
jgi:chromatin remodeling complex protein RSC6